MLERILNCFADWLIERARRTPYWYQDQEGQWDFYLYDRRGDPYMARYWLIPYNRFGIAARVHNILRSDEDRHLHDHPWWSISIILRGGYWEHMQIPFSGRSGDYVTETRVENVRRWRGPGSIIFRRAREWHRLELKAYPTFAEERAPWTLFITGPKRKDHDPDHSPWGFLVNGVKVPSDVYLGDRYVATDYAGGA